VVFTTLAVAVLAFAAGQTPPKTLPPRPPGPEGRAKFAAACAALGGGDAARAAQLARELSVQDPAVPVLLELIEERKKKKGDRWIDSLTRVWRRLGSPPLARSKLLLPESIADSKIKAIDPASFTAGELPSKFLQAAFRGELGLAGPPVPEPLVAQALGELGAARPLAHRLLAAQVLAAAGVPEQSRPKAAAAIREAFAPAAGRGALVLIAWGAATSTDASRALSREDLVLIERAAAQKKWGASTAEVYRALERALVSSQPAVVARGWASTMAVQGRADLPALTLLLARARTTLLAGPSELHAALVAALAQIGERLLVEPSLIDLTMAVGLFDLAAEHGGDPKLRWRVTSERERAQRLFAAAQDRREVLLVDRWPLEALAAELYEEQALGELAMMERLLRGR
jgi:hypothetical protein